MLVCKSGPDMHRCRYTKIQDNSNLDIRKHLNKLPSGAGAQNYSLATVGAWVGRLECRLRVRLTMARRLIGEPLPQAPPSLRVAVPLGSDGNPAREAPVQRKLYVSTAPLGSEGLPTESTGRWVGRARQTPLRCAIKPSSSYSTRFVLNTTMYIPDRGMWGTRWYLGM